MPFRAVVASVVSLSSRSQVKRAASVEFQGSWRIVPFSPSRWYSLSGARWVVSMPFAQNPLFQVTVLNPLSNVLTM